MTPYVDSRLWLPRGAVNMDDVVRKFTHVNRFDPDEQVRTYEIDGDMVGLPRVAGRSWLPPGQPVDIRVSVGEPLAETPSFNGEPRNEQQASFWDFMEQGLRGRKNLLATATTGSGKTVGSLALHARLALKTLVVVPNRFIADGWFSEVESFLGYRPGLVGAGERDWTTPVVIGMLPTLRKSELPDEFWRAFGFMVVDEVHTAGAPESSYVLGRCPAAYRLGLSATPERKDGLHAAFFDHLGGVAVESGEVPLPCDVYTVVYNTPPKWGDFESPRVLLSALADDLTRNRMLAGQIRRMYEAGRQPLGLSDRVDQLYTIKALLKQMGVPEGDIGIVCDQGYRTDADWKKGKRASLKKPDVAEARTKRIVLAIYATMRMGVNEPRWDAGIELTPRAAAVQEVGRIRRWPPNDFCKRLLATAGRKDLARAYDLHSEEEIGKKKPIWVTVLDAGQTHAQNWYFARRREFERCGCRIVR